MISVCIATYNGEKYIRQQLDSILIQLADDDEIIISDDGSLDNTISVIHSFNDTRIKIYHHKKEKQKFSFVYVAKNFENALNKANGEYIFLADQDDIWLPTKVENMISALKNADLVMSDCKIVDDSLELISSSKFTLENVRIGFYRNIYKSGYLGCCMAFRRKILKYILPIPANVPHDLWIGLITSDIGIFKLLHTPAILYRRHDNNVSATSSLLVEKNNNLPKNNNSILFKFLYRFYVIKAYCHMKMINKFGL
ncbi:glycosyltransferase [Chryseobacterium sp. GMJ5]|uniref:Glycosyltransferase n=1 Tax=Chryseobacterium gilvum TaxID=2976534 RepID=A0ABT2VYK0_9FLAO|nr:glycosyltransferase [Chryseobacterium gilvum]MCU7615072.1 glycosyltransferase [Chryseobacterium gilvum]